MPATTWSLHKTGSITGTGELQVFTLQLQDKYKTVHMDKASTLSTPSTIEQNHAIKAPGSSGNDRHTVVLRRVYKDAQGQTHTLSFDLTGSVPRVPVDVMAESAVQEMAFELAELILSGGFIANWVDGIAN